MTPRRSRHQSDRNSVLHIYLQDINATPLLSAMEERALACRIAEGDPEARDHMVKANLRLVVNIARGYLNKGLGLEDLIEEGNLGLMRAVEGFDGTMDNRFSTYASYWIKQSIRRAVMNQGKPIRLPAYMVTLLTKWKRVNHVLTEKLGRTPLPEEIGRALRLSKKKVGIVTKAIQVNNLTPHPEGGDEDGNLLDDVLTDDRAKSADDQLIEADDLERVYEQLDLMDLRESAVLRMRFGLDDQGPCTLREIGETLGLTRERVRQLESLALAKLVAVLDSERVS
ncbi:MAG: polymerase sigma factor, sigma-70 family [Planctomycetota bacterium]|nr:polymerase sigma factor, sigma-70 family [Planctomycetota bacterium]